MRVRSYVWYLSASAILTLALTAASAAAGDHLRSALAAALFAVSAIATGYRLNRPLWVTTLATKASTAESARALGRTTAIMAAVYFWATLAIFLIYWVMGLDWRNGWFYGAGTASIALCLALYAHSLQTSGSAIPAPVIDRAAKLSGLHGIAVAAVIIGMILAGKLQTLKYDWAINHVFLACGFAIMCLTMFSLKTHAALTQEMA